MSDDEVPAPPPAPKGVQLSNTVIIGGLFLIAAVVAVQEFTTSKGLEPGNLAPDVTFTQLDGREVPLSSMRGQVVLINFWATWCPPCVEELPELVSLAREYEGRVIFVAANLEDPEDAVATVPAWLETHSDARPHVVFAVPEIGTTFMVKALPTTYVLDAKGKVVHAARGQVASWQVKKWLDDALAN